MKIQPANKYHLRDVHQEIDFLDRKIAYCQEHEEFETENARATALRKLQTKRENLVKVSVELVGKGVECDPKYLPRSFRKMAESNPPTTPIEAPASSGKTVVSELSQHD